MVTWRLAKSLERLREQLNDLAPKRSKVSDGSIGDTSHASRPSDHNPDSKGRVTAIDITHDPEHGINGSVLSEILTRDPRTKYVIFSSRIWKARTGKWERYTGANAHKHHVHISVNQDSADDLRSWVIESHVGAPKLNDPVEFVKAFQGKYGLEVDGIPGPKTFAKLNHN